VEQHRLSVGRAKAIRQSRSGDRFAVASLVLSYGVHGQTIHLPREDDLGSNC
jgi:hypothetical protein